MYCGVTKPRAVKTPATPMAISRRVLAKVTLPVIEYKSLIASSKKSMPFRRPLLRTVVANPYMTPDSGNKASWRPVEVFDRPKLCTNKRDPVKLKRAWVLSPYGADRNSPAGEKMCKHAAMNASLRPCIPGNTACARL
jgi:hypothetical protein